MRRAAGGASVVVQSWAVNSLEVCYATGEEGHADGEA